MMGTTEHPAPPDAARGAVETLADWPDERFAFERARLHEGEIPAPEGVPMRTVRWRDGVDWQALEDELPTAQWYMHALRFLRGPLAARTSFDLEIATAILRDWHLANPRGTTVSGFAWDGHSTAIRAEQLACLDLLGVEADWLPAALLDHGDHLADPANYQGNWNHGLDQCIGLLWIGFAVGNDVWMDLARERATEATFAMVDWQGVSIEQATAYHDYNFVRFIDARLAFDACARPLPPEAFERHARMPRFLAGATQPDGSIVDLGDTPRGYRPLPHRPVPKRFAVPDGPGGTEPFSVFHAGYVFGHPVCPDGPNLGPSPGRPGFYSLRFGPARIIHGHNDHTGLTYHAADRPFLIDGGFHGYTDDRWRDHLRTPQAHNVVYSRDPTNFFWNATTRLTDLTIERDWQAYRFEDRPYDRTDRVRAVLFVQKPFEAIVVMDRVTGEQSRTYEQAWHVDPAFAVDLTGDGASAVAAGTTYDMFQLWPHDELRIAVGETDPIRGWAAQGMSELRPCPTLLTTRRGKAATFLTAFVRRNGEERRTPTQGRIETDGAKRQLTLRGNDASLTVHLMEDDTFHVPKP